MENMVALPVCLAVALVCSHEIFSLFSRWWSWWIWTPWRGTATWAICSQSREEPPDSVASNVWQWIALPALWKVAWDVKIFLHVFGFLSLFFLWNPFYCIQSEHSFATWLYITNLSDLNNTGIGSCCFTASMLCSKNRSLSPKQMEALQLYCIAMSLYVAEFVLFDNVTFLPQLIF